MSRHLIEKQYELNDRFSRQSLQHYLQQVVIASDPEPKRFGEIAEEWQRRDIIAPKVKAMHWLAGIDKTYTGPTKFLDILPRGHDKSSLEGRLMTWLLCYSTVPISGYLIACDAKQAGLILDAMLAEAKLNPWIHRKLKFIKNTVTGPAGTIEALPADDKGSYGLRGNVFIFDEFTHWPNDRMWSAVMSGAHKRYRSLSIVISNAGLLDTWQDEVRKTAKHDPDWHVFEAPEHTTLASWLTKEKVDQSRRVLIPSEAARVLDNVWIDPVSEADYLRRYEIQQCCDKQRERSTRYDPNYTYLLSWDYGRVNDRSVGVVGHLDEQGTVVIDAMDVFAGNHNRPITIDQVEKWIEEMVEFYNVERLIFDPYQMEGTIQKWDGRKRVTRHTGRQGASNMEIAMILRERIVNKRIVWYPGCGDLLVEDGRTETLEQELAALRVKRTSYGFRFDHDNNKHDDRAVALGMLALYASEHPAKLDTLNEPGLNIEVASPKLWGLR